MVRDCRANICIRYFRVLRPSIKDSTSHVLHDRISGGDETPAVRKQGIPICVGEKNRIRSCVADRRDENGQQECSRSGHQSELRRKPVFAGFSPHCTQTIFHLVHHFLFVPTPGEHTASLSIFPLREFARLPASALRRVTVAERWKTAFTTSQIYEFTRTFFVPKYSAIRLGIDMASRQAPVPNVMGRRPSFLHTTLCALAV